MRRVMHACLIVSIKNMIAGRCQNLPAFLFGAGQVTKLDTMGAIRRGDIVTLLARQLSI